MRGMRSMGTPTGGRHGRQHCMRAAPPGPLPLAACPTAGSLFPCLSRLLPSAAGHSLLPAGPSLRICCLYVLSMLPPPPLPALSARPHRRQRSSRDHESRAVVAVGAGHAGAGAAVDRSGDRARRAGEAGCQACTHGGPEGVGGWVGGRVGDLAVEIWECWQTSTVGEDGLQLVQVTVTKCSAVRCAALRCAHPRAARRCAPTSAPGQTDPGRSRCWRRRCTCARRRGRGCRRAGRKRWCQWGTGRSAGFCFGGGG